MLKALYKHLVKPLLFKIDPDTVHRYAISTGIFFRKNALRRKFVALLFRPYTSKTLTQTLAGINFPNPVGLSAGFDKNGDLVPIISKLGFGFTQVGTVTLHPYKGNKQPWTIRLPKSKGILVNYGLKNEGIDVVMKKLSQYKIDIPMSVSVGKTNSPTNVRDEAGIADYKQGLQQIIESGQGDLYTINISCPNTFGGEPFTTAEKLNQLLQSLNTLNTKKPIFLKMPINLEWDEFKKLLDVADTHGVAGVIIGNLNKNREDKTLKDSIPPEQKGALSGLPTQHLSNQLIYKTRRAFGGRFVIVGVGGIFSAEDAYQKIRMGASLVQLITGMIYEGPTLIRSINRQLERMLIRDGYKNLQEAVGIDADVNHAKTK